jgi:hypothetical protein
MITRQIEQQGDGDSPEDCALIPLATAKDIAFRGYDAILDLVDELPKNVAMRCNPSNPEMLPSRKIPGNLAVCSASYTAVPTQ